MFLIAEDFSLDRSTVSFGSLWTYNLVGTSELFTTAPGTFSGFAFGNLQEVATRTITKEFPSVDDVTCGWYFKLSGAGSITVTYPGNGLGIRMEAINETQIQITALQDGVDGEIFFSERMGQWLHLEMTNRGGYIPGQSFTARLDGFPIVAGFSGDTSFFRAVQFSIDTTTAGSTALIDNIIATDGGAIGPVEVRKYLPNSDTWRNSFIAPVEDSLHYEYVDDSFHDSGATSLTPGIDETREQFFFDVGGVIEGDADTFALGIEIVADVAGADQQFSSMRQGHPVRIETDSISDTGGSFKTSLFLSEQDPKTGAAWINEITSLAFGIELGQFVGKELIMDLTNGWVDQTTGGFPISNLGFLEIEEPYIVPILGSGEIELRVD